MQPLLLYFYPFFCTNYVRKLNNPCVGLGAAECPEKRNRGGERGETQGEVEGAGGAQPGVKEGQGDFLSPYNSLTGGDKQVGVSIFLPSNKGQDEKKWPPVVPRKI